jgi:hypothetical protein
MTVDELVLKLNNLDHDSWDVHIEDSWSNRGPALVITNGGVRTEISFDKPVYNNQGKIILGRWQR